MQVLAIIPARGGSKGLPGKNIRPLRGKPLIAWTVEAALSAAGPITDLVVSTDDPEIARAGIAAGAEAPFMRPADLATDEASSLDVMKHAVHEMETLRGAPYDWVLLLQPTSPLRRAEDIDAVLALAREFRTRCDSVISVVERPGEHPRLARYEEDGFLYPFQGSGLEGMRRQDCKPPILFNNGALYLTRRSVLMERQAIHGDRALAYRMPQERSVDIDGEIDFLLAELLLSRMGKS